MGLVKPQRWWPGINRQHPLWRRTVGCWKFDDGGGNRLTDYSGRGNHGTLTNMDPVTDWVGTEQGWGLDFDTDDHVVMPSNMYQVADIAKSGITFAALVRVETKGDNTGTAGLIGGAGTSGHSSFSAGGLRILNGATWVQLTAVIYDGSYKTADSMEAASLQSGVWHLCVGRIEANGDLTAWLDGKLVAGPTATTPGSYAFEPAVFYLGRDPSSDYIENAQLGFAGCWMRALSAREIAELFADLWVSVRPGRSTRYFVPAAPGGGTPYYYNWIRRAS